MGTEDGALALVYLCYSTRVENLRCPLCQQETNVVPEDFTDVLQLFGKYPSSYSFFSIIQKCTPFLTCIFRSFQVSGLKERGYHVNAPACKCPREGLRVRGSFSSRDLAALMKKLAQVAAQDKKYRLQPGTRWGWGTQQAWQESCSPTSMTS